MLEPWAVASALGIGLAFFGFADWTWQVAAAPLVDAGRELYVAWRLFEGDTLYTDIAWDSGPLAAWIPALVFGALGPGLLHLAIWNGALTALAAALLYRCVIELGGRLAAFIATLGFVVFFAFDHPEPEAGHGWLVPSVHARPLAVVLALVTLTAMRRYRETPRPLPAAVVGVAVGLSLLTSVQAALACLGAAVGGGVALAYGRRTPAREVLAHTFAGIGGIALPLLAGRIALGFSLSPPDANRALLSGVAPLFEPERLEPDLASAVVRGLGFDAPGHFLLILAVATTLWLLLLTPAVAVALRVSDGQRARIWGGVLAFVFFAGAGIAASFGWPSRDWVAWGSPLLVVTVGVILRCIAALRDARADEDGPEVDRRSGLMAFALAALGLLCATGLRARLFDVGSTAGVLAFALASLWLVSWLPRRIERGGSNGWVFRGAALGLLAVLAVAHLRITYENVEARRTPIGADADTLRVDELHGEVFAAALADIDERTEAEDRLLVVPEGAIWNYLARRPSGSPHLSLVPPALLRVGEATVLEGLMADPPEYVLVVQRETMELGARAFGRDYAPVIGGWIEQHYEPVSTFGGAPFETSGFGVELLERGESLDPPPEAEAESGSEIESGSDG
ncbi:MAG: hypothetical protein QNK05_00920 [Myxococcota bacterium]|nr:hypothetical protein [Myxococcota bacterium]